MMSYADRKRSVLFCQNAVHRSCYQGSSDNAYASGISDYVDVC
jgi:hypothetical protein